MSETLYMRISAQNIAWNTEIPQTTKLTVWESSECWSWTPDIIIQKKNPRLFSISSPEVMSAAGIVKDDLWMTQETKTSKKRKTEHTDRDSNWVWDSLFIKHLHRGKCLEMRQTYKHKRGAIADMRQLTIKSSRHPSITRERERERERERGCVVCNVAVHPLWQLALMAFLVSSRVE